MGYWLHQLSSNIWPSGDYKVEVWEKEATNWMIGRKVPKDNSPKTGDTMIMYYAPANEPDPGIYGWALVIRFDDREIRFIPMPPSDYLKMNPVWDDEVKNIIGQVRGRTAVGTLWEIEDSLFKQLRKKIAEHV
jgi:hypothetical protein